MSVSSQNRMLFAERRNSAKKARMGFLFFIVCGVIVATATHMAAFLIGDRLGYERGQQEEAAKPKRVVHVMQAAPWFGKTECIRACVSKDRLSKVVAK